MPNTKVCRKCKQEKSLDNFHRHSVTGHQSDCKDCKREESRLRNRTPERRKYNKIIHEQLMQNGYFDEYNKRS